MRRLLPVIARWVEKPPRPLIRYGFAIVAVTVAAMVRVAVESAVQGVVPFATFFAAIMLAAIFGGMGPGIIAWLMGGILAWYLVIPPIFDLNRLSAQNLASFLLFSVTSLVLIGLGELLRQTIREARGGDERLRELQSRFRAAQDLAMDGFSILRAVRDEAGAVRDFEFEYANAAACRMMKRSPDSVVGSRLLETMPGHRHESHLFQRLVDVVETGEPLNIELEFNSDGMSGHFRNATVKIGDAIAVQFADVTERKRTERDRMALSEKRKLLLKELNHRTRNSLQMIASIVQLQAQRAKDPAVSDELDRVRRRILTVAEIHSQLYTDDNVAAVNIRNYLSQLCDMLRRSLIEDQSATALEVEADSFDMPTDQAIPLGIIVNELVTNALKYAFPKGGGTVTVSFRAASAGWQLSVRDDGVGLTAADRFEGLGTQVVQSLAAQLRAEVVTAAGPGHGVILRATR